jgi:hypothetical protein
MKIFSRCFLAIAVALCIVFAALPLLAPTAPADFGIAFATEAEDEGEGAIEGPVDDYENELARGEADDVEFDPEHIDSELGEAGADIEAGIDADAEGIEPIMAELEDELDEAADDAGTNWVMVAVAGVALVIAGGVSTFLALKTKKHQQV